MSKAKIIWLSTNKQWKDAQLVIFCICSLCCPCVKPSYLFSQPGKTELSCMWWDPKTGHALFRVGLKERSSAPVGLSATQSLRVWASLLSVQDSNHQMHWSFSVFAVPASRLHIYLASMERQSFLVCDGIQTLDMLSIGLGSKKDRFSSSRPISDSCASSLSIFTVRARQQPPNALVV